MISSYLCAFCILTTSPRTVSSHVLLTRSSMNEKSHSWTHSYTRRAEESDMIIWWDENKLCRVGTFFSTKVRRTNWQSLVVKTPDGRAGSRRFVLSRNEWSAVDRLSAPIISWMSLAHICRGLAETCVEFPMLPATRGFQIKTESVVLYYSLRNKLFMPASTCQHAHCLRCNYRRVDT